MVAFLKVLGPVQPRSEQSSNLQSWFGRQITPGGELAIVAVTSSLKNDLNVHVNIIINRVFERDKRKYS